MNMLKKAVLIALAMSAPVAVASSPAATLPQVGSLASYAASWVSSELQLCFVKAFVASRATLPAASSALAGADDAVLPEGNHIVVEAKRLAPNAAGLRGWSGPRKKQSQR